MRKTTCLRIEKDLHKKLRREAFDKCITMSDIINETLKRKYDNEEKK